MATKYNTVEPLPKVFPLTSENLKHYQVKSNSLNNTKRFCQDLVMIPSNQPEPSITNNNKHYSPKREKQTRSSSVGGQPIKNRRSVSIKSNQSQRDHTCMESPRLLPFPYHNDSLFLPTVEHHRHQLRKVKSIASINSHQSLLQQSSSTNSSHISTSRPSSTPVFPPRRQLSAPPKLNKKYHPTSRLSSSIPNTTTTMDTTVSNRKSMDDHSSSTTSSTSIMNTTTKKAHKKMNNQHHSKKKNMVYNLLFKKVLKMVKKVSIFH
ncbi:unnamed protein product [Cunninghamella blakesleeana]